MSKNDHFIPSCLHFFTSEFDPLEIWKCVVECIKVGTKNLELLAINPADIVALGVTNQRETTVLWHRTNGMPVYNAIGKFELDLLYVNSLMF